MPSLVGLLTLTINPKNLAIRNIQSIHLKRTNTMPTNLDRTQSRSDSIHLDVRSIVNRSLTQLIELTQHNLLVFWPIVTEEVRHIFNL